MTVENNVVLKLAKVQDAHLKDKTVVARVDYNVPMKDGVVTDDTRIRATLKTLKLLLDAGCKVVLMAHLGRPKGKPDPKYSLAPIAPRLAKLAGVKVHFAADCVGPEADKVIAAAKNGEIVLLENLRYHPEEEKNDAAFAKQLAGHGEFFVQEAFGALHRAHASTAAIAKFLPGAIGFLVQKELEYLDKAMVNPVRPFLAIIGGAKVSDKINVLYSLLDKVDTLIIGGGMAYTFLAAQNTNIGKSLLEAEKVDEAKAIILKAFKNNVEMLLPADHRVAREIKPDAAVEITQAMAVPDGWIGVDIGPRTELLFTDKIKGAKTIFWNGPVGVFEIPAFASGSIAVAKVMAEATKNGAATILGGGDTLSVLKTAKVDASQMSHCSTGGGASLEFVEGKPLPGLVALSQK
ncbi:MAG: phosphoglycerate kinase [Elusimicrobia bacterium GWC2_51_8]|nr:MAG: phosphoglycerate kinase [Elusimicrobia bacterium GWA2_51_34]OGR60768.1 MAG: phosphoglycerate kinase [Elusimicrobia bacterium GWC2_51_8]OGR88331.1 MAG: phosphoglycerate kinase [Elusimicrobia bacterium GWF2_52_66]HAF96586.1 phosphoglycerate kinase [Elusimicrobiota bacterium]HCE98188.1 phosphoglycerate kinase [Elusimicrobiota bacterium]